MESLADSPTLVIKRKSEDPAFMEGSSGPSSRLSEAHARLAEKPNTEWQAFVESVAENPNAEGQASMESLAEKPNAEGQASSLGSSDGQGLVESFNEKKSSKVDEGMPSGFWPPVRSYDVHIYFFHTDEEHTAKAMKLREEIIGLFPDMNVYKLWDRPIGPHPVGMFEVDLKTPAQFARFLPWLNANRCGLSALIHPNTGFPRLDHTVNAIWLGDKFPLITSNLSDTSDTYGM